jgi:hypothetical protein
MEPSIESLINRYLKDELSNEERTALIELLRNPENQASLAKLVDNQFIDPAIQESGSDEVGAKILEVIMSKSTGSIPMTTPAKVTNPLFRQPRLWLRIAAVLVVSAGIAFYFAMNHNAVDTLEAVNTRFETTPVLPGGTNTASLTLADGTILLLDSIAEGNLAEQGNMKLVKSGDGTLSYFEDEAPGNSGDELIYNTVTTPRGGHYQLVLHDGTKVWLNAGSSLTFPAAFPGSERMVEMTGEAYFDVSKNPSKPFIVKVNGAEIRVLGTGFNVMAYTNEAVLKTTLIEGKIQFNKGDKRVFLLPGEQSVLHANNQLSVLSDVDINMATAWKNGMQVFRKSGLDDVMRQMERWYNVDVVFENRVPDDITFTGEVPRSVDLEKFIRIFETEKIQFKIDAEKRKVSVISK